MDPTIAGAFLAGLISFATPCVLPLLPFYLSWLAGQPVAGPGRTPAAALTLRAAAFSLGVLTVFTLLGLGASFVGGLLRDWFDLLRGLAAAVLAVFGLHFLGVLPLPSRLREPAPGPANAASLPGAFVLGLAFGFGWTPCAGPMLSAILILAAGREMASGTMLLIAYGLGMVLPFVLAAAASGPVLGWLSRNRRWLRFSRPIAGVMLLLLAIALVTDATTVMADALLRHFPGLAGMG